MSDDLLTANQIGEAIGVHPETVRGWKRQGVIPAEIDRGNFLRFDLTKVRQALREDAAKKARSVDG